MTLSYFFWQKIQPIEVSPESISITNLECLLLLASFVASSLGSLIMAVSCDTVECPSPDTVEDSESRLTEELPFRSAENV
jgi:isopropylmalate/homocitrate/citramalate synthase